MQATTLTTSIENMASDLKKLSYDRCLDHKIAGAVAKKVIHLAKQSSEEPDSLASLKRILMDLTGYRDEVESLEIELIEN